MAGKSKKTSWIVLFCVLFVQATLVALPPSVPPESSLIRTLILDGLTPIEKSIDFTINGVATIWNNYFALLNTRRENELLTRENAELRMERDRDRKDIREAERLRHLLNLRPADMGRQVVARVIGNDTTLGRRTVTIDKGRFHGLFIDAPVMTSEGIVGRVIHTGHFAAIVQLVADRQSGVGIVVGSSRVQGVLRGDGQGLELVVVDDDTELSIGDELLTSGAERIYPKGLHVGVIESLGPIENLTKTARIRPAADLARLEEVFCLIERPTVPGLLEQLTGQPPS